MKIAIVQIYNDSIKAYAEKARILNMLYATIHHYDYICIEKDVVPVAVSPYYNKIIAIKEILKHDNNYDWVLYLDADAIITNLSINIEDIVLKHQDKEIIMAGDNNGQNNGVILIKNTVLMRTFLQDVYVDTRFFHTKAPEQAAMFTILQEKDEYFEKFGLEEMWFFNGYLNYYADMPDRTEKLWNKDSFILHLQKLPNQERIKIICTILASSGIFLTVE